MSYIDWNAVEKTTHSGRSGYKKDGKIFYRDGSNSKSSSYRITLSSKSDFVKNTNGNACFGVGQNSDFFITHKDIPNVPSFTVSQKGNAGTADISGKDPVTKAIETLTGIKPKGNVELDFNLKKIDDNTYKFVDVEIL